MPNPKHLVIDDAIPYAEAIFSHLGKITLMPGREIDHATLTQADALIVRSRTRVDQNLLAGTPVQFVGSTVVGLDHIDQAWLKSQNIRFYSAQGCNANSVAEYVITCLLDVAEHKNFDLRNKTLGIIGVGHVGTLVHQKATKLGIQCLLNDPPKVRANPTLKKEYVDLNTCLKADMLTFHTPLTREGSNPTYHLLSAKRLAKIKPQQIIVNAARGGIIDEHIWAQTSTLANIIDCWENEPHIDEKLYRTAYLATPHIAGHSLDAKIAGSEMVYQKLCQFWDTPSQNDWRQQLPEDPEPLNIESLPSQQAQLYNTIKKTYNPRIDDSAIRDKEIKKVHNQYEYYRRNYPVHREWQHHSFHPTEDKKLNNTLISLGFNPH